MNSQTKKLVVASSIIGAIVIVSTAIMIRRRKKRKEIEKAIMMSVDNNITSNSDGPVGKVISWPLVYGSGIRSETEKIAVKNVQEYLNRKIMENNIHALPILVVDGNFGAKTENALYKIAGVKEVSYTLYTQMWNANNTLVKAPEYSYKPSQS